MIERGNFGPVAIIKGRWAGRNGYYDDDAGKYSIVYLDQPFLSEYILVRPSSLKSIKEFLPSEIFAKKHPEIIQRARIVVRR